MKQPLQYVALNHKIVLWWIADWQILAVALPCTVILFVIVSSICCRSLLYLWLLAIHHGFNFKTKLSDFLFSIMQKRLLIRCQFWINGHPVYIEWMLFMRKLWGVQTTVPAITIQKKQWGLQIVRDTSFDCVPTFLSITGKSRLTCCCTKWPLLCVAVCVLFCSVSGWLPGFLQTLLWFVCLRQENPALNKIILVCMLQSTRLL